MEAKLHIGNKVIYNAGEIITGNLKLKLTGGSTPLTTAKGMELTMVRSEMNGSTGITSWIINRQAVNLNEKTMSQYVIPINLLIPSSSPSSFYHRIDQPEGKQAIEYGICYSIIFYDGGKFPIQLVSFVVNQTAKTNEPKPDQPIEAYRRLAHINFCVTEETMVGKAAYCIGNKYSFEYELKASKPESSDKKTSKFSWLACGSSKSKDKTTEIYFTSAVAKLEAIFWNTEEDVPKKKSDTKILWQSESKIKANEKYIFDTICFCKGFSLCTSMGEKIGVTYRLSMELIPDSKWVGKYTAFPIFLPIMFKRDELLFDKTPTGQKKEAGVLDANSLQIGSKEHGSTQRKPDIVPTEYFPSIIPSKQEGAEEELGKDYPKLNSFILFANSFDKFKGNFSGVHGLQTYTPSDLHEPSPTKLTMKTSSPESKNDLLHTATTMCPCNYQGDPELFPSPPHGNHHSISPQNQFNLIGAHSQSGSAFNLRLEPVQANHASMPLNGHIMTNGKFNPSPLGPTNKGDPNEEIDED